MPHVVLLGDSIFDNGAYIGGKPDVIAQLRHALSPSWEATLLAVDGATTRSIPAQIANLPDTTTHLVLSVGGNDALGREEILHMTVHTSSEALLAVHDAAQEFELVYREVVRQCLHRELPLTLCTIYNGNFPLQQYRSIVTTALAVFNDAIIRIAIENGLTVIDLRRICTLTADYANPIEPSSIGGEKIAQAIKSVVTGAPTLDARIFGGPLPPLP
jgi:hypothetical protein